MRPGLVFVGLFALLMAVYAVLSPRIGTGATFAVQAALVFAAVAGMTWLRRRRQGR